VLSLGREDYIVTVQIQVEKLVYGGDGLARVEGEVVLMPFVLPGELVEIEREPKRAGIARARVEAVREKSPDRITPPCPYFGHCGGCHYQHADYPAQLAAKRAILAETLARTGHIEKLPEIQVIAGEPWGYRNRIQLHFEKGKVGYRQMRSHKLQPIEHCPISSPKLNQCIAALTRMVRDRRWPDFLETAEFFTNETDVQMNVLETGRPLAQRFFDWCAEQIHGLATGVIEYEGYRVGYGSFFQVNRFLAQPLLQAVVGDARGKSALDLYSGVGFFSIPLAQTFEKVTAVESGAGAARDLEFNAKRAGVPIDARSENVDLFLRSLDRAPDLVIADPPRAGLGKQVVRHLAELKPREITLVACDPATLARDAQGLLAAGYELAGLTLIDLFPQTYHIETIARFTSGSLSSPHFK
jgi:23S rRNA (uracil1939-C5)-methyltransferase